MFKGHEFIKINDEWVFDITEYKGYHVKLDKKGHVLGYNLAYIYVDSSRGYNCMRYMNVPLGVLRRTYNIIKARQNFQTTIFKNNELQVCGQCQ